MKTEVRIHGVNGIAELGTHVLSVSAANNLIDLMKKSDWIYHNGENYKITTIDVDFEETPMVTNIYTKIV